MSVISSKEVYYATRKLLPYLSPELQARLKKKLKQARQGQKADNLILNEIADSDDFAREWMRAALFGEMDEASRLLVRGAEQLAGQVGSIRVSSRWVCPKCDFTWFVRRAGQQVPPCPVHRVLLIPVDKKKTLETES